jgi:hypothetical protein
LRFLPRATRETGYRAQAYSDSRAAFALHVRTSIDARQGANARREFAKVSTLRSRAQIAEARGGQMNCPANKEICKY